MNLAKFFNYLSDTIKLPQPMLYMVHLFGVLFLKNDLHTGNFYHKTLSFSIEIGKRLMIIKQ